MKKRLTDCDCWKDPWFRKLNPVDKLIWIYILHNCECWGVWKPDQELISFFIGREIVLRDSLKMMNCDGKERIKVLDSGDWFVLGFIDFQYGELSESCNAHKPVISNLKRLRVLEGYLKGTYGLHNKEQDKDKDKNKDKNNIRVKEISEIIDFFNITTDSKCKNIGANKDLTNARLNEGYKIDDFKVVIRKKHKEWKNTEMDKFIRIETLFSKSKFDGYLNQKESTQGQKRGRSSQEL